MERTTQTRVTGIPRWATAQVRILHTQRAQCEAEQASFADTHIKKAESRKRMHLQQSASKELVVNLAKLYGAHLRTERRKLGVCLLPQRNQLCLIGVRAHSIDHLLFKNSEDSVQILERHHVLLMHYCREFAETCRDRGERFIRGPFTCGCNSVRISLQIPCDALIFKPARMCSDFDLDRGDVSRSGRALHSRSVHLRLQLRPHFASDTLRRAHFQTRSNV